MDIENICNLLLEALAEAGFSESTLFNYRGVIRRFKSFCNERGASEYTPEIGQAYACLLYTSNFCKGLPGKVVQLPGDILQKIPIWILHLCTNRPQRCRQRNRSVTYRAGQQRSHPAQCLQFLDSPCLCPAFGKSQQTTADHKKYNSCSS